MDVFSKQKRREIMRRVKSANTFPERYVRKAIHKAGYRFRLQADKLPGNPDILLPRHRMVVFVHGCFWHGHRCSRGKRKPATNKKYWDTKIARNIERDRVVKVRLRRLGWNVHTIWECRLDEGILKLLGRIEETSGRRHD